MKLNIRYKEGAKHLSKSNKQGDIDVYSNEDIFIPIDDQKQVHLGFYLELPKHCTATFFPDDEDDCTGINFGVLSLDFLSDDEWVVLYVCREGHDTMNNVQGTYIHKGDYIGQIKITKIISNVEFKF